MSGRLYVGTSGFAFPEWKGSFYPTGLPAKKMLEFYSQRLGTVEINYSFRRMPAEATVRGWAEHVSGGFLFTLKAPQRITHFRRLRDAEEDVAEFLRLARLLGDNLGTVLFQLPPTLQYERAILEPFLDSLPRGIRYAMEFRHDSWRSDETVDLLRTYRVALCGADTEQAPLERPPVTAPHAYLRLRKEEYSSEEIGEWGARIGPLLGEGVDVFCYFKHEGGGVGPAYASALEDAVTGRAPLPSRATAER